MSATGSTVPRRRAGKGVQRRAEIVEAAKERLIDRGIEGLVLREVASELGITHGNLQYYFPTKNDLIKAIFDAEVERFTTAMHESVAGAADAADMISEIVDANLAILARPETRLWRILFGMAEHAPYLAEILKQENGQFESVLAAQLGAVAPHLSDDEIRGVSKVIRLMIDGVGIEFIYIDPTGPAAKALAEDIKRAVRQLVLAS